MPEVMRSEALAQALAQKNAEKARKLCGHSICSSHLRTTPVTEVNQND